MQGGPNPQSSGSEGLTLEKLLAYSAYPALKAATVLPTQALFRIGSLQQTSSLIQNKPSNFLETAANLYKEGGVRNFFKGTVPGMTREAFKACYKGPLQVFADDFSVKTIPNDIYGAILYRGLLAGSLVGIGDPLVAASFERYKTFSATQKIKGGNIVSFFNQVYSQQQGTLPHKISGFVQELYKGTLVTIGKQTLMNVAFFTARGWAENVSHPYQQDYPKLVMAFNIAAPGAAAAAVGAPLDLLKTRVQSKVGDKKNGRDHFKSIIKQSGWRALFAGAPAKFLVIMVGYSTNGLFLNLYKRFTSPPASPPPSEEFPSADEFEKFVDGYSNDSDLQQVIDQAEWMSPEQLEKFISDFSNDPVAPLEVEPQERKSLLTSFNAARMHQDPIVSPEVDEALLHSLAHCHI